MTPTEPLPTQAIVDDGPVLDAVLELLVAPALADHVRIEPLGGRHSVYMLPDDVPYALWGSGAQALWRLLLAVAYTRHEVSLYEVVRHLDLPNRAAVSNAIRALCQP